MNDAERLAQVQQLMTSVQKSIAAIQAHLEKLSVAPTAAVGDTHTLHRKAQDLSVIEDGRVLEGVFDGQNMIGPDGRHYPVPANYASKSKLVEGDVMKLTIDSEGRFRYKQIAPIARKTVIGTITKHDGEWRGLAEGKYYKILLASITFYRAEEGDRVALILPAQRDATWGAVDNVIKQDASADSFSEDVDLFDSDASISALEDLGSDEGSDEASDAVLYDGEAKASDLRVSEDDADHADDDVEQLPAPESMPELDAPEPSPTLPAGEDADDRKSADTSSAFSDGSKGDSGEVGANGGVAASRGVVANAPEHTQTLAHVAQRMTKKHVQSRHAKEDEFALM